MDWTYASEHLPSVLDESPRRQRMSLHADVLNERHTKGGLAAIMPMDEFVAADYFLFLLGEMPPETRRNHHGLAALEHALFKRDTRLPSECRTQTNR